MISFSKNILIVGAGKAGRILANDIAEHYKNLRIVGFVDDGDGESPISGVPILGKILESQKIADIYRVDEILIAIPSADGALVRRILLENIRNRIPVRIVPREQRIISEGSVRYDTVKDVVSEDFLGRPFIDKNIDRLKKFYRGKKLFITGGAGSIGSEIVRQAIDIGAEKIQVYDNSEYLMFLLEQQLKERGVLDRCELVVGSILHDNKLNTLLSSRRPDIVFHAAAYKHVHLMQDNVDEAVYNNVVGTRRVVDAVVKNSIGFFTFISTDKVVNPTSVMGATKKLCEHYVQHLWKAGGTKFNIVRFGNVINSNGSALPLFERQMALHRYVTVTHPKMERFFMSIREAASLVIESMAFGKPDSIHILNMGELINIHDIALCLIRSKNLIPGDDIEIQITGLRKGEKMIEELYTDGERLSLKETDMRRVLALQCMETCQFDISAALSELEEMVKRGSEQKAIWKYLKKMFPSIKLR